MGHEAPATPRPKALQIACVHPGPLRPIRALEADRLLGSMLSDTQLID